MYLCQIVKVLPNRGVSVSGLCLCRLRFAVPDKLLTEVSSFPKLFWEFYVLISDTYVLHDMRIDKFEIWRKYYDHAIIITMLDEESSLAGMIVDDTPDDYCGFVTNPNIVDYYETRDLTLVEKIYFKDVKSIEFQ